MKFRSLIQYVVIMRRQFVCVNFMRMTDAPPGNNPVPDFQGDLEECSRYALGKGIASGFMKKKTVPGQEIDVAQNEVSAVLCNQDGMKVLFVLIV